MKHIRSQRLALTLALILAFAAICPAGFAAETPVEELNFMDAVSEYTRLDLRPYRGKAVFLNFFTEWCPYCMIEMPDIKTIFDTYSSDDLQIVLVHVWDGEDATHSESIRKRFGLEDMTFFEDEDKALTYGLQLQGYPASIFLDQNGDVFSYQPGMLTLEQMTDIVDRLGVGKAGSGDVVP